MPIGISRFILSLEGLVLGLPLVWVYMQAVPYYGFSSFQSLSSFLAFVLLLTMGASLVAALTLMGTFSVHGLTGLRQRGRTWWWLCGLGAALALVGVGLYAATQRGLMINSDLATMFYYGGIGVPLLIPYAHVLCENFFRAPAPMLPNPSLERP